MLSGCPPDSQPPPCQRAPSCPLTRRAVCVGTPGRRDSRSAALPRGALRTGGEAPPKPRLSRLRPQTWGVRPGSHGRSPGVRCAHLVPWPRRSRPGVAPGPGRSRKRVCKPRGLSAQPPRARPASRTPPPGLRRREGGFASNGCEFRVRRTRLRVTERLTEEGPSRAWGGVHLLAF